MNTGRRPPTPPSLGDIPTHGTSSAFSSTANPEEDWTKISDLAERRRIQSRIAQRNYRKKLKRRLEDLERRAESSTAGEASNNKSTVKDNAAISASGNLRVEALLETNISNVPKSGDESNAETISSFIADTAKKTNAHFPHSKETVEGGYTFSYNPFSHHPSDLTPRSASPGSSVISSSSDSTKSSPAASPIIPATRSIVVNEHEANFTLEEFNDSDYEAYDAIDSVIRPQQYEDAESDHERDVAAGIAADGKRIGPSLLSAFKNLGSFESESESESGSEDEERKLWLKQQQRMEKRRLRRQSRSTQKRSIAQGLGSDTDEEDLTPIIGEKANEPGSSARRLRRKTKGERVSLQFDDPPPRIDELQEEDIEDVIEVPANERSAVDERLGFGPKVPTHAPYREFAPKKYEWEAAADWQEGLVNLQTSTFKNLHYNASHYHNPVFQPEEWSPKLGETSGSSAGRKNSAAQAYFESIVLGDKEFLGGGFGVNSPTDLPESSRPEPGPSLTQGKPSSVPISTTPDHRSVSRSSSLESLLSLVDSIFSTATISSASTVSSVDDAFQRVLVILKGDVVLRELYKLIWTRASAEKFNRNFGTLLKRFAVDLEQEATCWNEQRAAQFIRTRARKLAAKVSDLVYPSEAVKIQLPILDNIESSDDSDSNSDSEPDEFQELESFITASAAFQRLRNAFQAFLGHWLIPENVISEQDHGKLLAEMPFSEFDEQVWSAETTHRAQDELSCRPEIWSPTRLSQKIREMLDSERPVPQGMSRVKWKCPCGEYLYDDYKELKPGAAKQMEDYLRRSSHKIHTSDTASSAGSISSVGRSIKSFVTSISSHFQLIRRGMKPELVQTELRYYSDGRATRTPAHTAGEIYYLLLCHNDGVGAEIVKLRQPDICDINTDQKLFSFLHDEYKILRKRWWTWISLWTLQSIKFVRFELYENQLVDIKKIDEVPPPSKDNEYRHGPPNPPELNPPLGSTLLMHLFKHPELAGTRKHCLKKIPRKLRERLAVLDEENDSIGWGLQFIEGWSKKRLMYMTAMTFGFSSLVVMILVSIFGQNIQNAAAIASFMLSFVTIGIATAQAALHMS